MKIALGGLKSPIKNLQQHGGEERRKLHRKTEETSSADTLEAARIKRRRWSSNTSHMAAPLWSRGSWFMGPKQPLPLGTSRCLCRTAHNHSWQHSTPGYTQPQSLLGCSVRPSRQQLCPSSQALDPALLQAGQHPGGTGAAADPQEPAL